MKKSSIFYKIFFGNLFILLLLVLLILGSSFKIIRAHYVQYLETDLKNIAQTLTPSLLPLLSSPEQIDTFVKNMGKNIHKRITIITLSGKVIADSEKQPSLMDNHNHRPEIQDAYHNKVGVSLRYSKTVKKKMLYVAVPIYQNKKVVAVVRVSVFLTDINQLLNVLKRNIFIFSFIIVFISLLFSLLFSMKLASPIRQLVKLTKSIAQGNFKDRIYLTQNDEVKILGDNFNLMAEQLEHLVNKIQTEKIELQRIISFLREGLVVIDAKGKIRLYNKSFKKLIDSDVVDDRYYWEMIRNVEFVENIKKLKQFDSQHYFEINLKGKFYLCSASFIPQNNNMIAVFHDISEMKKLEHLKKKFVSNVSHELRTPLTIIYGFLETIAETEHNEKTKHYLNMIIKHTERLIQLVKDLLTLSEMEDTSFQLHLETLQLKDVLLRVLVLFESKIQDKNLQLIQKIEEVPVIKADEFKLEQVFINLIDNAIKYTDTGSITITLKKEDHNIVFEIRDTGVGIRQEDLEAIFDRFFVVDKSRSKKSSGTGLGLSIVKHIIMLHNAEIKVQSEVNKGTAVTIYFPI